MGYKFDLRKSCAKERPKFKVLIWAVTYDYTGAFGLYIGHSYEKRTAVDIIYPNCRMNYLILLKIIYLTNIGIFVR